MYICVFDTETTSLEKPFCYDIGYLIVNTDDWTPAVKRSFVVEQVWHNLPLFTSAYYAAKRQLYVSTMRTRASKLNKYGYICQQMIRDFREFEIEYAFAYNSSFDEKVFNFNCDWYKCNNPFDNVNIRDIRGFVHEFLINKEYKAECEDHGYFTETGNYSTTAETVYRVLFGDHDFNEAHTALKDAEIESDILFGCFDAGADLTKDYKAKRSIERVQEKTLHIQTAEQTDYYFDYQKIKINKEKTEIILK